MGKRHILTSAILLALVTTACTENKTTEEYLASGHQMIASGKFDSAIIELKNAAKQNPRNVDVRIALGKAYVELGRYKDAEKELERAIDLGGNVEDVFVMLSFTKLKLGNSDFIYDLLEKSDQISDNSYVKILINAGITAINEGEFERGQDYLGQALTLESDKGDKLLAKAYTDYSIRSFDAAIGHLEEIEEDDLQYYESQYLLGNIFFIQKDYQKSVDALTKYQKSKPFDVRIDLLIAKGFLALKNNDEADQVLSNIPNIYNISALANLYKAQIEFDRGNFREAKQFSDTALQLDSGLSEAKVVAGLSSYELGNLEQAYFFLNAINSSINPKHPLKRLIAFLKLELGYPAESAEVISEFEQIEKDDISLIVAASFELIKQGSIEDAQSILDVATGLKSTDEAQLAQIALLKHASGSEKGISDLQKVLEVKPESSEVNVSLAALLISKGKLDQASEVARSWLKLNENNVEALNLVAKIHLIKRENIEAKQNLNKVLAIQPANEFALLYFAREDLDSQNTDEALTKIGQVLAVSPHSLSGLSHLYKAHKQKGTVNEALAVIEAGFLENQKSLPYRIFLAQISYEERKFEKIVQLLSSLDFQEGALPVDCYQLLGDSYYSLGSNELAREIYTVWSQKYPDHLGPWYRKLQTYTKEGNDLALLNTLKEMLNLFPNEYRLKSMLPHYQILNKKFDQAEMSINQLSTEQRNTSFIKGLIGQIQFSRKEYMAALPNLKLQYDMTATPRHAGLIYTSLIKLDKAEEALSFFQAHLGKYPNDLIAKTFYAQFLLQHDIALAAKMYEELLLNEPNNIVLLNNTGWAYYKLGKNSEALKYLNLAIELKPDEANLLDTLALIHYSNDNRQKALKLIEQANELSPNNKKFQQHMELIKGGEQID